MSHELTAAGCVLASIAHDHDESMSSDDLLLKITMERNELEDKVKKLESQSTAAAAGERARNTLTIMDEMDEVSEFPTELKDKVYDLIATRSPGATFSVIQICPYPFPCPYCHLPINSPEDIYSHSDCGVTP